MKHSPTRDEDRRLNEAFGMVRHDRTIPRRYRMRNWCEGFLTARWLRQVGQSFFH
jgi:hypothetical protein